jgi:hypothetical protein
VTLADGGCLDQARRQLERAAALAADTPLMKSVEDSRERIRQPVPSDTGCRLADRAWPE